MPVKYHPNIPACCFSFEFPALYFKDCRVTAKILLLLLLFCGWRMRLSVYLFAGLNFYTLLPTYLSTSFLNSFFLFFFFFPAKNKCTLFLFLLTYLRSRELNVFWQPLTVLAVWYQPLLVFTRKKIQSIVKSFRPYQEGFFFFKEF